MLIDDAIFASDQSNAASLSANHFSIEINYIVAGDSDKRSIDYRLSCSLSLSSMFSLALSLYRSFLFLWVTYDLAAEK